MEYLIDFGRGLLQGGIVYLLTILAFSSELQFGLFTIYMLRNKKRLKKPSI